MSIAQSFTIFTASLFSLCACRNPQCSRAIMDQKKHAFIDGVKKSESDRQRLIMLASNGDAKAASELAQHFFLVEHNYERAKYWFREAAKYGGSEEKEVYQSFLESIEELEQTED